jgi:hypothetical protein
LLISIFPQQTTGVCCETREDKRMRRVLTMLALLCSLVLIMTACGRDGEQGADTKTEPTRTTEAAQTPKKIPEPGQTLAVGTEYVTTEFQPGFSFRVVDKGWQVVGPEIPDIMDIAQTDPFITISFTNPQKIYDPKRPTEQVLIPEPKDWVAWHQNHPYLKTGKITPVTIGGVSGAQFESELSSAPRNYPEYCRPIPCVPMWPLSDGGSYDAFLGDPDLVTIVEVSGETVIIDITGQEDKFEEMLPKAKKILETVEWKDGS